MLNKGKPVERWGRKATGLRPKGYDSRLLGSYFCIQPAWRYALQVIIFTEKNNSYRNVKLLFRQVDILLRKVGANSEKARPQK